jgi:hypothetical protein
MMPNIMVIPLITTDRTVRLQTKHDIKCVLRVQWLFAQQRWGLQLLARYC